MLVPVPVLIVLVVLVVRVAKVADVAIGGAVRFGETVSRSRRRGHRAKSAQVW